METLNYSHIYHTARTKTTQKDIHSPSLCEFESIYIYMGMYFYSSTVQSPINTYSLNLTTKGRGRCDGHSIILHMVWNHIFTSHYFITIDTFMRMKNHNYHTDTSVSYIIKICKYSFTYMQLLTSFAEGNLKSLLTLNLNYSFNFMYFASRNRQWVTAGEKRDNKIANTGNVFTIGIYSRERIVLFKHSFFLSNFTFTSLTEDGDIKSSLM